MTMKLIIDVTALYVKTVLPHPVLYGVLWEVSIHTCNMLWQDACLLVCVKKSIIFWL